jgi:hypothetical protein
MPSPGAWLTAFLLTFLVEAPIVVALTRDSEVGVARRVALVFFAQLVTHPLVWFVFPYIVGLRSGTATLLSEIWAWLAEAVFYALVLRGVTFTRALAVSAIANGASVLVGVAMTHWERGVGG